MCSKFGMRSRSKTHALFSRTSSEVREGGTYTMKKLFTSPVLLGAVFILVGCSENGARPDLAYTFEFKSTGVYDISTMFLPGDDSSAPSLSRFETRLEGTLILEGVAGKVNSYVARFAPQNLSISIDGKERAGADTPVKDALKHPFLLTTDKRGYVRSVQFPEDVEYIPRELARQIVSYIFMTQAPKGSAETWHREEGVGGYTQLISYRRESGEIVRSRFGQLPSDESLTVLSAQPSNQSGTMRYKVDPDGTVRGVSGGFQHDLVLRGKKVGTDIIQFRAKRSSLPSKASQDVENVAKSLADTRPLGLAEFRETRDQRFARLTSQKRDWTSTKMLAKLQELEGLSVEQNKTPARHSAALAALCELESDMPDRVFNIVKDAPGTSSACSIALTALGEAGTPQAQNALRKWIEFRGNDALLISMAAFSLASVETPSPAAEDTLVGLAQSSNPQIAEAGMLAYGAMIDQMDRADEERAAVASQLVLQWIRSSDPEKRRIGLLAAGNTGRTALLNDILQALENGTESDRYYAANSLTKFRDPVVVDSLLRRVESDSSAVVRGQAAKAMSEHTRSPKQVDRLVALATQKDDEPLTQVALRALVGAALSQTHEADLQQRLQSPLRKDLKANIHSLLQKRPVQGKS